MSKAWHNFKQVTEHIDPSKSLFRSSSPNYLGFDLSQTLTSDAIQFLKEMGIQAIVSFNQYSYNDQELDKLKEAGIEYLHLPVFDFHAATLDDLKKCYDFYVAHESTLIHCGYGHGRTGTAVTAVQLYYTKGKAPPEADWSARNHVEKDSQMEVLRQLRGSFQSW